MRFRSSSVWRCGVFGVAVVLATVSGRAQTQQTGTGRPTAPPQTGRPAPPQTNVPLPLYLQVRNALGHGALDQARSLVAAAASQPAASRDFAAALVDIYEGRDDDAKAKLSPLAVATPTGEAALELGLLELRHGRRAQGRPMLERIWRDGQQRANQQPQTMRADDFFRLARAAFASHESLLANDAYQQIANEKRADIQTSWADFFVQRRRPDLATPSIDDALAADPAWVEAHLVKARAFEDTDPDVVKAALAAAVKLAPNDPGVLVATAEKKIEVDDFDGAKEILDKLAAVKPGTIEEAALRVVLAYEKHDPKLLDAAIARVKDIDPLSARGWIAAAEQAAHDYRFEEGTQFAQRAVDLDAEDPMAHFDLGLYLMRTGDEARARIELEQAFKLDDSNKLTKNLLDLLDSLDKFVVVPNGDLIFKFDPKEAEVLKAYALPLAAEAMKTYTQRYGFTPKGPILVEVFPRHDDFAVRTIGLTGITGALGACFGRVVTMDSASARPPGEFSWQATLWHELAHVYTLQLSQYRVPRWLTEGISVYEEHRKQAAWGREMSLEFARQLGKGKTFGLKGLWDAFKNPENFALAYFEASLVVEHLVELNGDEGLRTLLRAYADGASDADAFTKAFGKSVDTVDASFKTFVDRQYGALRDAMKDPPNTVTAEDVQGLKSRAASAPGNYISQLALGQVMFRAADFAAARAALEKAAQLAPQASGDGSPHALLAQIAIKENDNATARTQLRALLLADHANVNAARKLAQLAAEAKAIPDEDYALRLVADLAPFDKDVHGQLGKRLMAKSDFNGALIEFQAALAMGPANRAEAHADIAEAFLKLNRKDEAKKEALEALKEAPTFARAQDLYLAALGRIQ